LISIIDYCCCRARPLLGHAFANISPRKSLLPVTATVNISARMITSITTTEVDEECWLRHHAIALTRQIISLMLTTPACYCCQLRRYADITSLPSTYACHYCSQPR